MMAKKISALAVALALSATAVSANAGWGRASAGCEGDTVTSAGHPGYTRDHWGHRRVGARNPYPAWNRHAGFGHWFAQGLPGLEFPAPQAGLSGEQRAVVLQQARARVDQQRAYAERQIEAMQQAIAEQQAYARQQAEAAQRAHTERWAAFERQLRALAERQVQAIVQQQAYAQSQWIAQLAERRGGSAAPLPQAPAEPRFSDPAADPLSGALAGPVGGSSTISGAPALPYPYPADYLPPELAQRREARKARHDGLRQQVEERRQSSLEEHAKRRAAFLERHTGRREI